MCDFAVLPLFSSTDRPAWIARKGASGRAGQAATVALVTTKPRSPLESSERITSYGGGLGAVLLGVFAVAAGCFFFP
jgi:hypothetical protein